jgi:adenosylhomocysteinase
MLNLMSKTAEKYFCACSNGVGRNNKVSLLLITHILPTQPPFFSVLSKLLSIDSIIAIPYSIDKASLEELSSHFQVITPTFKELSESDYLLSKLKQITSKGPIIIQEIGGYCAKWLKELPEKNLKNILGIVEDTEKGHRSYENIESPCPVISVARSSLKSSEDALIGAACLFSTERIVRKIGLAVEGQRIIVLGFGKIGRSLCFAAQRRSCLVSVFDTDPIRLIQASSEGFSIAKREKVLSQVDFIFGTTGNCSVARDDFPKIKSGAILISCSSKNVEFDLEGLKKDYQLEEVEKDVTFCKNNDNYFYLLGNGFPINFLDHSAIGPTIALSQAEMLVAIQKLLAEKLSPGLHQIDEETRRKIASRWLEYFSDPLGNNKE